MPTCILERIHRECLRLGLNPDDAHDCVAEVCLRYHRRTGAFPHDEETPDLRLLRLLTLNVVREFQRAQQRRQRLEQDYLALQRQQQASAPTPMAQATARVDCERFRAQLPDYLRRTLERMEAGDTPKAIAAQLGVAVGTVYSYQRELRERFVAFFGYDPRKSGVRVVNYSGCSEASSSDNTQEVQNDATAEDSWRSGVVVSSSEPGGVARHPDRSGSDDWRGGAAMAPAMSSGCGCKQTMTEISQQAVKQAQEEVAQEGSMHQQSANNRGTGPIIWEPELPEDRRPPKPLGILLVCTNKSELGPTWDINNRMPQTRSQMRFQVLLKTDRGWFTVGSYNPNRIRGVYWDGSFWSSIAQDGERIRDVFLYIEDPPFNAQEWRWSHPDIQWLTGITHNVDRETFFSSVQTTASARYYMYNHNPGGQAGSAWWRELSYTEPGMRIVGVKFRIRLEGKEYIFYACPPPGVLDSGPRAGEAVWESKHNQAAKSTAGLGHEIPVAFSGYHMRRPPVWGTSAFTPIFVRTDPRYWDDRRGNVGSSSIAASVFTDVAVSFVGIPYQWGGKRYLMLASTVDHDPRSRTGTQGFGLDCSGFVYCALSRTATLYGFYSWITTEDRFNFGVHRIMARSDRLRGHSWMQRGDLFCRPKIGDREAHVAIYLGYGAAIPGSINYNVVECASDGQVEGCVIRDLPSPSTYDPYRLRLR